MTTESAGDRDAVMDRLKYYTGSYEAATDEAISALRARGVSRGVLESFFVMQDKRDEAVKERDAARAEIARLRAALELISGDSTWHPFAREALDAGAKP